MCAVENKYFQTSTLTGSNSVKRHSLNTWTTMTFQITGKTAVILQREPYVKKVVNLLPLVTKKTPCKELDFVGFVTTTETNEGKVNEKRGFLYNLKDELSRFQIGKGYVYNFPPDEVLVINDLEKKACSGNPYDYKNELKNTTFNHTTTKSVKLPKIGKNTTSNLY